MDEEFMIKLQDKWGKHVFNSNHPAYTEQIWLNLIQCVRRVREAFPGKLDGFDRSIIKRQLYHMMFLEENPNDVFETIAYNDSEYLDNYNGHTGMMVKFANSGLPNTLNISYPEFIKLPNWLADWAIEWALQQSTSQSDDTEDALKKLEADMKREAIQQKKNPSGFKGNY